MGLIGSLDLGSDKLVMALAEKEDNSYFLKEIVSVPSGGIDKGIVIDEKELALSINELFSKLKEEAPIDILNVGLYGSKVQSKISENTIKLKRSPINQKVVNSLIRETWDKFTVGRDIVLDIIPNYYFIDGGDEVNNPVGKTGKTLSLNSTAYYADKGYIDQIEVLLNEYVSGDFFFYPHERVVFELIKNNKAKDSFAFIDLGAEKIKVIIIEDGILVDSIDFEIGVNAVDYDLMTMHDMGIEITHQLKIEYGEALKSIYKNVKVRIPDSSHIIEGRDLVHVIQTRMEEIFEGILYYLYKNDFKNFTDPYILISGGGACLKNVDKLLERMSGFRVGYPNINHIRSINEDELKDPSNVLSLGLLMCQHGMPVLVKDSIFSTIKTFFK